MDSSASARLSLADFKNVIVEFLTRRPDESAGEAPMLSPSAPDTRSADRLRLNVASKFREKWSQVQNAFLVFDVAGSGVVSLCVCVYVYVCVGG